MLESKRLILKPATIQDSSHFLNLNSDPDVVRYTGDNSFRNFLEAENTIKEKILPQFNLYKMGRFSVFLKDGTFLGWCGLKYHPETNEIDLGYRFKKKYWGKGYATEASKLSLDYGFNELGHKRIIAKTMPDNIGSIKVMQKIGMTFRGHVNDPTDPHPFVLFDIYHNEFTK